MLASVSQRLIQFKRILAMIDLAGNAEKTVTYAASLARWYGSELFLVHAFPPEFSASIPPQRIPTWPASGEGPEQDAAQQLRSLADRLNLQDLKPEFVVREASMTGMLDHLNEYHPSLLVMATHGREGVRKWLAGSVAEEVFRHVEWPVLVLGPGFSSSTENRQKQFENVLYGTDLSSISLTALQYAVSLAHDHEAQLTVLYVEPDPAQGFQFNRTMLQQHLQDWMQDHIDGLSDALVGADYIVDFGKPETRILDTAEHRKSDLVVLGSRGLGAMSGPASHFLDGTAYEVACTAKCPVLIVPQPR